MITFNTKTGEVTYGEVLESEDAGSWGRWNALDAIQGGSKGSKETLVSFNGDSWWNEKPGLDEIKVWPGTAETIDFEIYLPNATSFNEVYGVVYVPKGWQG